MISDVGILFLITGLIAFVTLIMDTSIRREIIPALIGRKITHMANGVLCILAIPLMESMAIQVTVGAGISLFALYAQKSNWLSMNNPEDFKSSMGIFFFPLSFTILMFMWGKELEAVSMMSLLIMSFSDSSASLFGSYFGKVTFNLRGGKKTLEGSMVFFLMTIILFFIISVTPSFPLPQPDAWNLYLWWASAIMIAVLLTFLEAMSFRGSDNLTVPLLGSILIFYLLYDPSWEKTTPFYIGLAFSLILVLITYKLKILDTSGAVGAVLIGTWIFGYGQWAYAIPLLLFFFSSGLLSRIAKERKQALKAHDSEKSGRNLAQVMANGGLPAFLLMIGTWQQWDFLFPMYLALLATATADTWATEIGTALRKQKTYSVSSFRLLPQGVSGGISVTGTAGAFLGSLFIAALGFVLIDQFSISVFLMVAALGFTGAMIDSLIGDLWQLRYLSPEGVKRDFADGYFELPAGIPWLNNDMVNFVSGLITAVIAILVFAL
jgi:uncharacterized protein (TIGR00297 family)